MRMCKLGSKKYEVIEPEELNTDIMKSFTFNNKGNIRSEGSFKDKAIRLGLIENSYIPEVITDELGVYCLIFIKKETNQ